MWNVFRQVRERARASSDNLAVFLRLGRQTGLFGAITKDGASAIARAALGGSQNPAQIYRVHARNTPSKAAVVWRGRMTTWAELDQRIERIASGLHRRGIGRKASVATMMRNRQESVEVGAGVARAGAAMVGIPWRSTSSELAYLVNHSGARALVVESDFLPAIEKAAPELAPHLLENVFVVGTVTRPTTLTTTHIDRLLEEDPMGIDASLDEDAALVIYTSGTTGRPKGAVRKFPAAAFRAALRFVNETPMRTDDVHLVACPLYHSTAFAFLSLSHLLGATVVLMDEFRPEAFLELVEKYGVTTTTLVPTMLHRILELPDATRKLYDTSSLRLVFSGGSALPGELGTRFMDAFGDVIYNFYGATETGFVTLAKPEDLRRAPGTIGHPVPGNEIRLLDDQRRDVAVGDVGELFVKNQLLVVGYHDDDAATKESMFDGFFSVGDLARRDADGRYFVEGRKRDMIISGGVNVYPAEVERVLGEHPDVSEAAVVGGPDPEWGERVRAFVVLKMGATADEGSLMVHARQHLSGAKVPREIVILDALPRNPTGKILKRELRERGI